MRLITRTQAVNELIKEDMDNIINDNDIAYLEEILRNGHRGYAEIKDLEQLEDVWEEKFGEEINIKNS